LKPVIGGRAEPFWRHFNTDEWEPEWRGLVELLEHQHVSTDWHRAIERLHRGIEDASTSVKLGAYREWLRHLTALRRHERCEQLCAVLGEVLKKSDWRVIDHFLSVIASSNESSVDEQRLCLRVLRGMCLLIPEVCDVFVGEWMESLISRLLDNTQDAKIHVEVLELLLVVIADNQTRQRDFMRRNGVTTVCTLHLSSESTSVLGKRTRAFIGILVRYILPRGASVALSNALTAEARESVEETVGADGLGAILASVENLISETD